MGLSQKLGADCDVPAMAVAIAYVTSRSVKPTWAMRLASAHAVPRESRADGRYRFEAQRFRALSTPTLLLAGGDSPALLKAATQVVAAALPNSRVAVMPGQQHIAMNTAPELFVKEVLTFLREA